MLHATSKRDAASQGLRLQSMGSPIVNHDKKLKDLELVRTVTRDQVAFIITHDPSFAD